jgi:hypothetical protein
MLINKIRRGVVAVETEAGVRYLQPSLLERILLTWTFRNFRVLPEEVLNSHERAVIDSLCRNGKYVANGNGRGDLSLHCIGIVERSAARQQPRLEALPPARVRRAARSMSRAS